MEFWAIIIKSLYRDVDQIVLWRSDFDIVAWIYLLFFLVDFLLFLLLLFLLTYLRDLKRGDMFSWLHVECFFHRLIRLFSVLIMIHILPSLPCLIVPILNNFALSFGLGLKLIIIITPIPKLIWN